MIPWEREIYVSLLTQYIEEENLKNGISNGIEDPRVIAQRGVNPLTGSYLSKRERIAMFRSANVSSSAFGGGRGGRGLVRS